MRGEILFGVKQLDIGRKRQSLEDQANNLFSTLECKPIPENTGDFYAEMKIVTKSNGKTLGESDLWIAATALALDAVVVTSDNNFYRIRKLYKSLKVKDWTVQADTHGKHLAPTDIQNAKPIPIYGSTPSNEDRTLATHCIGYPVCTRRMGSIPLSG